MTGIFLSVSDSRLEDDENASPEVNDVTLKVGVGDGGGSYFDLHTGTHGFGQKVSEETILVYLKRFGITDEQINKMFIDATPNIYKYRPKPVTDHCEKCFVCQTATTKTCAKCKTTYSCGSDCQKRNWPAHKTLCGLVPFEQAPQDGQRRVRAIFFPEDQEKPQVVYVPLKHVEDEDGSYDSLETDSWISGLHDFSRMCINPFKGNAWLKNSLRITFRDTFLKDGSKSNKSISKMTENKQAHDWRGPSLVAKFDGVYFDDPNTYLDIEAEDLSDIRDFFLAYGTYKV